MKPIRLALVGATGMIGKTTLAVLEEWKVPLSELKLYASIESAGKSIKFGEEELKVHSLTEEISSDIAILALSSELSLMWAPKLTARGICVIDHSSTFRMDDNVPLVIPEINAAVLNSNSKIVANPNCSASIILMALAPLERTIGLKRVIISTYQSVSGAGLPACDELNSQLSGSSQPPQFFPRRIAGNVFPEIGKIESDSYTGEETKISQEICKILERPDLHVTATAVRVPIEIGHSASVSVELSRTATMLEIETALKTFTGLKYDGQRYSTPLETAGEQNVHVGRVRIDPKDNLWLHFWVVGDNTRKGAASNAVQILQLIANL